MKKLLLSGMMIAASFTCMAQSLERCNGSMNLNNGKLRTIRFRCMLLPRLIIGVYPTMDLQWMMPRFCTHCVAGNLK